MSRKRAGVEILAGLLALAIAGTAWGQEGWRDEPPEGLDYLMAMQCAALTLALADVAEGSPYPKSHFEGQRFQAWARWLAQEAGATAGAAERDIAASRGDFLTMAGSGDGGERRFRLM
jgi:hypothetical protein